MYRKRNNCNIWLASIIKQTREGNDLSIARSARDDGPRRSGLRIMLASPLFALAISALFSNSASAAMLDPSITLEKTAEDSTFADVRPTASDPAPGKYTSTYLLTANNVKDYAVYVSTPPKINIDTTSGTVSVDTPNGELVGIKTGTKISNMGNTQAANIGAIAANTWGFRASFDSEPTSYYTGVPVLATENQENREALESTAKYIGGDTVSLNTPVSRNIYLDVATRIDTTVPADTYKGAIILSAVATPAGATIFDISSMQQMTPEICSNTITPTATATIIALDDNDAPITNKTRRKEIVYDISNRTEVNNEPRTTIAVETYLMDERDEKSYLVAKLADGRCWMIQNLALESNTDRPKTVLGYNAADGALVGYNLPASKLTADTFTPPDMGFMYNGSYIPNAYNTQGYAEGIATADPGNGTECYGNSTGGCNGQNSGSYYSWLAATAGSGSSYTTNEDEHKNASSSICPKGWELPTGGTDEPSADTPKIQNGQFQKLYNAYGSNKVFASAWHGGDGTSSATQANTFAGFLISGTLRASGGRSNWWSSTAGPDTVAYYLYQGATSFNPALGGARRDGYAVRCVAATEAPTPVAAKTMQEFSKTDCSNLTGETELIDSRDNKVYKVAKLEDGNCWMIQNLALGDKTPEGDLMVLTSETSDVTSNYPMPESSTTGFSDNSVAYVYNGTHIGKANNNKQIVEHAAYDTNGYDGTTTNDGANSGAYYSWLTAKAGKANADESVCPSGWKLPSGGASGQLQTLYGVYGDFTAFQNAWRSGSPGRYDASALGGSDANGSWWASTVASNANGYNLYVDSSGSALPKNSNVRRLGTSVRCIKTPN